MRRFRSSSKRPSMMADSERQGRATVSAHAQVDAFPPSQCSCAVRQSCDDVVNDKDNFLIEKDGLGGGINTFADANCAAGKKVEGYNDES